MDQKVSVIIPTADRPESLAYALASLRAQNAKDIQVIVVNDGGADVRGAIAPFRDDLGVELVDHDQNLGAAAARNTGMDVADGDFVMFLDDDDVVLPGHFDAVTQVIADGKADVVYATMKVSTTRHEPTREGYREAIAAFDYDFDHEFLLMANYIPPAGLTMRRPGPDGPRFDTGVRFTEDWDMWLRMAADGHRFHHADVESVIYHRLPRHDDKADPPASEARAIRNFQRAYTGTCARFAVATDSPAVRGRALVQRAYEHVFTRLDQHKKLVSPYWWEDMLRVLHAQYTGKLVEAEVDAALQKAVSGS